MNVIRDGSVLAAAQLVGDAADRDEVARLEQGERVLVADALAVEGLARGSRRPVGAAVDGRHATAPRRDEAQLRAPRRARRRRAPARGTCTGPRARAGRSGSGASRSSGRGTRPDSRSARSPRARAAPARRARPHRRDERVLELARARRPPARAPPTRRTPSAGRCARATAGRGRDAGSGPRTRSGAPRRRSGASRPRPASSSGTCSARGSSTFVSTTDVALSGVTATERTRLERERA